MNDKLKQIVWQYLNQTKSSISENTSYQNILGSMLLIKLNESKDFINEIHDENQFRNFIDELTKSSPLPNAVVNFLQYKYSFNVINSDFNQIRELIYKLLSIYQNNVSFCKEISNMIIHISKNNKQAFSSQTAYDIMKSVLSIEKNDFIFDPFAGAGENLLPMGLNENKVLALEINTDICELLEINAYVNGYENFEAVLSDAFEYDKSVEADKIISEPPLGLRYHLTPQLYEVLLKNEKIKYSKPSKASSDWLAIEYILSSLKDNGVAAVLVASGALMRTTEKNIREQIIKDDVIEAVIELPKNVLQPYTAVQCCVLVLNKNKKLKNQILSIDLTKVKKQGYNKIIEESYHQHKITEGISCILDNQYIIENDCNLMISQVIENEKLKTSLTGMIQLKDVIEDVYRGMQVTSSKASSAKESEEYNCYLLNMSNIIDGEIEISEEDKIFVAPKALRSFSIHEHDLIITSRGTFKTAVAKEQTENVIASNNIIVIRLKTDKYDPYVLQKYFESDLGKQVISSVQIGSTATTVINPKNLIEIMIPDINKKEMLEISAEIKESTFKYKISIKAAQEIFQNESQQIFNKMGVGGKINVR